MALCPPSFKLKALHFYGWNCSIKCTGTITLVFSLERAQARKGI